MHKLLTFQLSQSWSSFTLIYAFTVGFVLHVFEILEVLFVILGEVWEAEYSLQIV